MSGSDTEGGTDIFNRNLAPNLVQNTWLLSIMENKDLKKPFAYYDCLLEVLSNLTISKFQLSLNIKMA